MCNMAVQALISAAQRRTSWRGSVKQRDNERGGRCGNVAAALPKPQNEISASEALRRLLDGNLRYVTGVTKRHDFATEREALSGGQNPYAAVLSCADSRVAPEYAFDTARGDLFVARVAGNIVSDDVLGSLEYAVVVLNVPLLVVLGHDKCGAVNAAVKALLKRESYPGRIQGLVKSIIPSVEKVKASQGDVLGAAIMQNVFDSMRRLRQRSRLIDQAAESGRLQIVGGVYRLETGSVDWCH
jgi:carbonic anhydrase